MDWGGWVGVEVSLEYWGWDAWTRSVSMCGSGLRVGLTWMGVVEVGIGGGWDGLSQLAHV